MYRLVNPAPSPLRFATRLQSMEYIRFRRLHVTMESNKALILRTVNTDHAESEQWWPARHGYIYLVYRCVVLGCFTFTSPFVSSTWWSQVWFCFFFFKTIKHFYQNTIEYPEVPVLQNGRYYRWGMISGIRFKDYVSFPPNLMGLLVKQS